MAGVYKSNSCPILWEAGLNSFIKERLESLSFDKNFESGMFSHLVYHAIHHEAGMALTLSCNQTLIQSFQLIERQHNT